MPPGNGYSRSRLIHDLAAQNKTELLLWDTWLMDHLVRPTEEQVRLLDRMASLTQAGNKAFGELRALYEGEALLKAPPVVTCHSPAGKPRAVRLAV